jgi:D-alanyl-D-alanine carboxypeptidase
MCRLTLASERGGSPAPLLTVALLLLLGSPAFPGATSAGHLEARQRGPDEVLAALDSIGRNAVESGATVGLALGVYRQGVPILSRGFGYADLENGVPVSDSTVFRVGSVTKQFTAAAILRLEEEGRLSLDDDLTRFLPDYPSGGRRITIHQLLNHTSGIPSYTGLGERWQEVIREEFFEPLRLRDTHYCWEGPLIARRARGYQREEGVIRNAAPISMAQPYAAGALCSSVRDLARWDRALRTGEVVRPSSYDRMIAPRGLPAEAPLRYGYGLVDGELDGWRRISHGGGIHGFNAALAHFPDADLTVVALVNLNGPGAGRTLEAAARAVLEGWSEGRPPGR